MILRPCRRSWLMHTGFTCPLRTISTGPCGSSKGRERGLPSRGREALLGRQVGLLCSARTDADTRCAGASFAAVRRRPAAGAPAGTAGNPGPLETAASAPAALREAQRLPAR